MSAAPPLTVRVESVDVVIVPLLEVCDVGSSAIEDDLSAAALRRAMFRSSAGPGPCDFGDSERGNGSLKASACSIFLFSSSMLVVDTFTGRFSGVLVKVVDVDGSWAVRVVSSGMEGSVDDTCSRSDSADDLER